MPVKNDTSTRFIDEVRVISPWVFVVASVGFLIPVAAAVFASLTDRTKVPPLPAMIALVIIVGSAIACYILLIGYVNRDAGRRGMNRLAWTLIAILIPNGLGIVLYFILRKPRTLTCPACGAIVEPGFGFCPRCRHRLNAICPHCQRGVNSADKFCPYCGGDLAIPAGTGAMPLSSQT